MEMPTNLYWKGQIPNESEQRTPAEGAKEPQ